MKEKDKKYQAPALDKGLDIIEYLSSQSIPLSQTEIATGIDRSSNEIYRMLMSLENRGYILRDEISGKYRLSLKLYHLSHRHSPIDELIKAAQFPLEELAQSIRQSCHISILHLNQVMVVMHAKSPEPIALSIEEGNLFPLPLTASGKVLLAYLSTTERELYLSGSIEYRDFTDAQKKTFLESLKQIKSRGYYVRQSDMAEGVVDISVPIGETNNGIIACLTISRLTTINAKKATKDDEILAAATACSKIIQKKIGLNQS